MADITGIWSDPMLRKRRESERQGLIQRFPVLAGCSHSHYLSLGRFFDRIPERFYCRVAFSTYWEFLESEHRHNPTRLRDSLADESADLSQALFFLDEVNHRAWHDRMPDGDDFERLRFVDYHLHPAYLRLVDGVYFRFIRVIALISRRNRGAGTDGLDLFSAVQELQFSPVPCLGSAYRNILRNGIAHGGVVFGRNEVTYTDKRGNSETFSVHEVVRLVDDIADACNGMALAVSLFLFVHLHEGISIPKHLLLTELQTQTRSPWWRVDGCVPCTIPQGSQLLIFAHPDTRDSLKVQFYAFYTAVLAELLAPGFDRYFLSLRSDKALPGLAAFDGSVLRRARELGSPGFSDYMGALVDGLLLYAPHLRLPRMLGKLDTLWQAAKVNLPLAINEYRERLGSALLMVRTASVHRNGWFSILGGSVVITTSQGEVDQGTVRTNCRRIIAKAEAAARRYRKARDTARWLPLGWGRVAVFRRDYRQRRLSGFGLGADLICTVQVSRLERVRAPDILGSTVETVGRYRIAWNKAWLDEVAAGD